MKKVSKSAEPSTLAAFRASHPDAQWRATRQGGKEADRCLTLAASDQHNLCAYCESTLIEGQRAVEHFHDKSDSTPEKNWHYDWQNMIAVCDGGTSIPKSCGSKSERLSCDAHKNTNVQSGDLPRPCEGWILNPLEMPAFPCLFFVDINGKLSPDATACSAATISSANNHDSVEKLVVHTISMLNLNCDRLLDNRKQLIDLIETQKKRLYAQNLPIHEIKDRLTRLFLPRPWPQFFTTRRSRLGTIAEDYLKSIGYDG